MCTQVPARLQGRVEMIGGGAGQGRWQDLSVLDEEHGTDLSLQDHESMLEVRTKAGCMNSGCWGRPVRAMLPELLAVVAHLQAGVW